MTPSFAFVAFPYVAWILAILGGIYRYRTARYTWSSLSSQTLESRKLYWGSVAWHYAIIPILLAHLFSGLLPGTAAAIVARPWALFILEAIGLGHGLHALAGIAILFARRLGARSQARPVTSAMDWVLLAVLAVQVLTGVATALFVRWGSRWYPETAAPWFWSIARFQPDPAPVLPLPELVQIHFLGGFLVIALFPFTRLVHLVSIPLTYLWRPYQVVCWYRTRGKEAPSP